jgi:hypothetical protein
MFSRHFPYNVCFAAFFSDTVTLEVSSFTKVSVDTLRSLITGPLTGGTAFATISSLELTSSYVAFFAAVLMLLFPLCHHLFLPRVGDSVPELLASCLENPKTPLLVLI